MGTIAVTRYSEWCFISTERVETSNMMWLSYLPHYKKMSKYHLPLFPGVPGVPGLPGNPGLPGDPCSPCGPIGPGEPVFPGGPATLLTATA